MKTRTISRTGQQISEVGIGTWELAGDVWGPKDDTQSKAAILAGVNAGATFIDCAAGYGSGHVEKLIGELLNSGELDRTHLQLSTKILPKNGVFAPSPHIPIEDAYPADWILTQCHESISRMNCDYIDMLFIHTWSRAWDGELAWLEAANELKESGVVKAIGISVPDERPDDANYFIGTGQIDVVQLVFNVFQQEPQWTVLPLAKANGVGVIARSPFSSGAIVQDWNPTMTFADGDWRASWPLSVKPGWLEQQCAMAEAVKPLLDSSTLTHNIAALRYVLDFAITSVIPGSANPQHVTSNMSATSVDPLSKRLHMQLSQLWIDKTVEGTYNGSI